MKTINNTQTIHHISEATGYPFTTCQHIVKIFEATSGGIVLQKALGHEAALTSAAPTVAEKSGYSEATCAAVLTTLDGLLTKGLHNKKHPFHRI